jgi:hypothetical protein
LNKKNLALITLSVLFGLFWLLPLLLPVTMLERYAFEELRVLALGGTLAIILSKSPKIQVYAALTVFCVLWEAPLFLTFASPERLALEELRVVIAGYVFVKALAHLKTQ